MSDKSSSAPLILKIISPVGLCSETVCDSIVLNAADSTSGKGGGSYGIRKGHAPAIIATADGTITAKMNNEVVFSQTVSEGTASVYKDTVTVITSR